MNEVLDHFLIENQKLFTEAENLGLTFEAIEVIIIPVEKRIIVKAKEFQKNSLQIHQKECGLHVKETPFEKYNQPGIPCYIDMRNLDPAKIEELLNKKDNDTN